MKAVHWMGVGFVVGALGCASVRQAGVPSPELVCRCGPMRALTAGAGNDTEAVWSPDGARVAYQTDAAGDLDLATVDVKSGRRVGELAGKGHACYPAWTPDGRLIFSFGCHPETAAQAATQGKSEGFNLRIWDGQGVQPLTAGYHRDYAPSVTRDTATVYFTSTRECADNSASLWKISLKPGASAERVLHLDGASVGAVQPSVSPDGRFLVWAQLDGFRQNWRLCAARAAQPLESVYLTPEEMSAYAPRWSPDGTLIACTGFRGGDAGWGVYLVEPRSGACARLETGRGNSRSPDWSPDGKELVFENNGSGLYKLYRMPVSCRILSRPPAVPAVELALPHAEAWLEKRGAGVALVTKNGAPVEGTGSGAYAFEQPSGLAFGTGPFYVKVTLAVHTLAKDTQIVAVGHYAEHALGWQVFVREGGKVCFNSRTPDGQYVGVQSDAPLKPGKPITVIGVRDADGTVRLSVGGEMQKGRASGATLSYGPARRVCLGQQWNGGMRLSGRIDAFECGRGTPAGVPRVLTRDQLFAEEQP